MAESEGLRDRYVELTGRVDRLFDKIHERYGQSMQCSSGCTDCCHARLTVTLIEAAYIAEGLMQLPAVVRAELAARAEHGDPSICPALSGHGSGQCQIYAWRPLVCRSHGAPIRQRADVDADADAGPPDRVRLPVIDACPRNFDGGRALAQVEPGLVFDQNTLSTVLGAIDAAFADSCGAPRGTRIDLAALLAEPEQFFDVEQD